MRYPLPADDVEGAVCYEGGRGPAAEEEAEGLGVGLRGQGQGDEGV